MGVQNGDSPLALASARGYTDVVRHLIAAGANCNVANRAGRTPLIQATRRGREGVVRELLRSGRVDVAWKDVVRPAPRAAVSHCCWLLTADLCVAQTAHNALWHAHDGGHDTLVTMLVCA